jgi:hypothetical protein
VKDQAVQLMLAERVATLGDHLVRVDEGLTVNLHCRSVAAIHRD